LSILPPNRLDDIDPPDFYKPTIVEDAHHPGQTLTHPEAADKNQMEDRNEVEHSSIDQLVTGKGGASNANDLPCQEERGEITATDDSKDDDSTEPVGKEEASKLDQDMMIDDDEEDEKQEPPQEIECKSRKVTSMFQKILSFGSAGHMVVDVGSDMQPGLNHLVQNMGPSARQPTLVHQGRKVRATEFVFKKAHHGFSSFSHDGFVQLSQRSATYQTIRYMLVQQQLLQF
jgi:hypothetical protein